MADDESASHYGLDNQVFGFIADGNPLADANADPPSASADNPQPFYGPSPWEIQVSAPFESFDVGSSTATPAASCAPPWPLPTFDQRQRPQSQASPSFDGFPTPGVNPETVFGSNSSASAKGAPVRPPPPMSHEELRNIAMPPHLHYNSPRSEPSPESANSEAKVGAASSPELTALPKRDSRKRKPSDELEDDDGIDEGDKPVKKTAHNMIEKRYRTNINDKIAALRDCVPSLRIMSKSARGEDTTEDRQELHGLTPAHKLNKATVFTKATEYIRHLEKRNSRLSDENDVMKARIEAFEKLIVAGAMNGSMSNPMQQPPTPMPFSQENQQQFANPSMATTQDSNSDPPGMIDVPEDMKRIISAQMAANQPYPVPQQPIRGGHPTVVRHQQVQQQQQEQQQEQQLQRQGWAATSPYFGKLMVGSLAGLMVLEAVGEDEKSNEDPQGRGLYALPLHLIGRMSSALDFQVMGYHVHTSLKLLFIVGAFFSIFVPLLLPSPNRKIGKQQATVLRRAPSLASSIDVRRQAWLTAIQTVWVPRHNFFLEASALILKAFKLSLRNVIGVHAYQILTGLGGEEEAARVKAWSIALDSQLAGGDIDICKSRLVLTLLASGTLPDTPARLMLKALHIRVLLWEISNSNRLLGAINAVAAKLARKRWNEARQLNRLLVRLRRGSDVAHEHELPEHLAALVEQESDDVLGASVMQRASNLAFNVDTASSVESRIDGMDAVVDDVAIGSPMDAVAAWWSTQLLHRVLTATLDEDDPALRSRAADIGLAIKVAPQGSVARIRAILARAVLIEGACPEDTNLARQVMTGGEANEHPLSRPMTRVPPDDDLTISLKCATAIAQFRRAPDVVGRLDVLQGIVKFEHMSSMTLLGFTAMMELMKHLLGQEGLRHEFDVSMSRLSIGLRIWMGRPCATRCGVSLELRNKLVARCLAATKSLTWPDKETGYGSLSDGDEMDD
ncbi:hypothetical protein CP533_4545 [Ophiocordyceps camponoti-saundersi (nom. inval.)]|nr:hypothetical protein CP533_4545 [Ophiocordyceps camponoti-saundersi (nom. inval.)]